jgi:hypothetical protein
MTPDGLHVCRAVRDEDFPILFTYNSVIEKLKAGPRILLLGRSGLHLSDLGKELLERAEATSDKSDAHLPDATRP